MQHTPEIRAVQLIDRLAEGQHVHGGANLVHRTQNLLAAENLPHHAGQEGVPCGNRHPQNQGEAENHRRRIGLHHAPLPQGLRLAVVVHRGLGRLLGVAHGLPVKDGVRGEPEVLCADLPGAPGAVLRAGDVHPVGQLLPALRQVDIRHRRHVDDQGRSAPLESAEDGLVVADVAPVVLAGAVHAGLGYVGHRHLIPPRPSHSAQLAAYKAVSAYYQNLAHCAPRPLSVVLPLWYRIRRPDSSAYFTCYSCFFGSLEEKGGGGLCWGRRLPLR